MDKVDVSGFAYFAAGFSTATGLMLYLYFGFKFFFKREGKVSPLLNSNREGKEMFNNLNK